MPCKKVWKIKRYDGFEYLVVSLGLDLNEVAAYIKDHCAHKHTTSGVAAIECLGSVVVEVNPS